MCDECRLENLLPFGEGHIKPFAPIEGYPVHADRPVTHIDEQDLRRCVLAEIGVLDQRLRWECVELVTACEGWRSYEC